MTTKVIKSLLVLVLLILGIGNAWAGKAYMKAQTADPAKGLVYMNKNGTAPSGISSYQRYYPGGSGKDSGNENCYVQVGTANGPHNNYYWAIAARGYKFKTWDGYTKKFTAAGGTSPQDDIYINQADAQAKWKGEKDLVQGQAGGNANTWVEVEAVFDTVAKYTVTYGKPVGGSYTVGYSYLKTRPTTGEEYELYINNSESYSMTPSSESDVPVVSWRTDEITLTVPNETTNFIGWYEGSSQVSASKTYKYTAHANVTICPMFKELAWGDVSGDLTTNVTAKGEFGGKTVYVAIPTLIGSWESSDFSVAPMSSSNDFGSIAIGTISLDKTTNPNRLVIPYTYTATNWGGVETTFTITPTFGATKQFSVACSAEEVVNYEACIEENEVRTYTGTLAEMMTQANSMNNQPTLKLMNNKTITAPLSFTNSFTFDVNGKVLTANCASAFSIDAAGKDVKIIDGSFTQVGEIHTSNASSGIVSVVGFTQAAKLTMQGGTLSAENTGTGSAYGVNVCNGSIFYMTNGQLTVTGVSEAHGVHVATESDYATLNGGSLTVSAPTQAYGLWSAGQSNITDATIDVDATTGAKAYGAYINGGTSTLTTTAITADAKTTEAYGAYVNAGRLNGNGGSFAATAVTSGIYGVHVAAGATAMVQMNAVVTAEATGTNGTSVFGVNNLGTVSLANISVTATSPTTAATAVNTASNATSTTIEGGTYRANTTGGTAYGLHHQYGTLNVDGGTFRAVGGGNSIYGARAVANGTIANATLHGETTGSGNTAYGFVGGVAGKTIALAGCTIEGVSNTSKAYAIYSRAIVTATGCTLTATTKGTSEAYGLYAENGTNALINCNATVSANTIKAYGVNHVAGGLTISGGQYDVEAKQDGINNAQNTELYGIYNEASKTTMVEGATFNVIAKSNSSSQYVYGAYIKGTLNSINSAYTVSGKTYVYGIYGHYSSSPAISSTLTLAGNTVSTTVINGTASYGIYAKKNFTINGDIVSAQGNAKGVYALFFDKSTSIGEVLDGKFSAMGNGTNDYGPLNATGTVGSVKLKGGVAKTAANLKKYVYTGYDVYTLDDTHPDYAAGYRYIIADKNPSPYVCYIKNGHKYESLKAALQYVKDNSDTYTIIMTQSHTLPAGDYELPSNATLIIPRNTSQNTLNTSVPKDPVPVVEMIEEHIRLTMATGANLNVSGKIEVGGKLYSQEYGKISYNNCPYARLYMENSSMIQLNDGARLYAWGYISGNGAIKAKSGSKVYEMFQVGDMPAISPLGQHYLNNDAKYFPVQVYSIQNIEVPTTYYYNSELITAMYEYNPGNIMGGYNGDGNIHLIGNSGAMFQVTSNDESSWVRKSFSGGRQIYEVNSSAKLGSLVINVGSYEMNSANYILPITATMNIHILDGSMEITQSTMFQPGTQVEIDKTATLKINSTYKDGYNSTQALKVYVLDQDQWLNSNNPDAAWNVHGNIDVYGSLFTSTTDGANIYSNNLDAGTVSFKTASAEAGTLTLMTNATTTKSVDVVSANLKNGSGITPAYTSTASTSSGEAYIYLNNQWQKTYTNGCFEVIGSTVYAKPSGYVALKKSQTDANSKLTGVEETNHTYLTADDKILILMDECQWWEVEATSDPAVFECKKSGYEGFYYYDDSSSKWKLKTVNVKFYSAETGDNVLKTIVTDYNGIPDQAIIPSNPTKATTTGYTYTFYGWKSSVTGTTYKWTDQLEVATADMSYRPVFTETKRNYTITLNDANNGATVYLEVPYGDMPAYEAKKDATAEFTYSFNGWNPEFIAVNGTKTYTAQWTSTKNRYTVTWMNGEDVLETDKNQEYGKLTSYDGATPTKAADNNYAYTFSNWLNSLTGNIRVNNETVTGAITYTAQFSTTPRYMITFANYDGTQLQKEPVTQNETPIYNGVTPARARDLDGYYIFTGWKRNSTGVNYAPNANLPAATEKETYTAQYSYTNDLFLITLKNVDGNGGTWSGKFGQGSTPFYNPNNNDIPVIPTKTGNAQYSYTFDGWSLTSGGAKLDPVPAVSGEAEYWALFTQTTNKYNITFANIDGFGASQTIQVEYGSVPVCPVVPKKEEGVKTWAFEIWEEGDPVAVTGDATYTAQFSSTYTTRQFDITFDLDNGTQVVVPVTYGETPSWTGETPVKPADAQYTYTFSGWYPDFEPVTEEASYLALYTETVRSYTVRFVDWDGTELKSSSLNFGATPTPPSNPTRPAQNGKFYTFNGWSPAISSVAEDKVYTAQYTELTGVATVTNGTTTTPYSTWSAAFQAANQASGCTIKLYADVTADAVSSKNVTKNMTIDLNGYTISCTTNSTSTTRVFYIDGAYTLTINDSKGSGHDGMISFTGSGNAKYFLIDVYNSSAVATINGGIIQMNYTGNSSNYGSVVRLYNTNSRLNLYGGELIATATNGKGYAIEHDYSAKYGYAYIYGGKLKAKTDIILNISTSYKDRNTISGGYYSKSPGTANSNITVSTDYELVQINNATEDPEYSNGYTYKVIPKRYTLTWNVNGGDALTGTYTSGSVSWGTAIVKPTDPTRTGYTFNGWNTTPAATMPKGNTTYTAQWGVINYTIGYTLNGGSATNPENYNIETTTFSLNNPTKNGYTFTGWTGSNGSTPQTNVSIAKGSTGNKEYTANWTPTNYIISYELDGGSVTPANPSGYTIETATFSLNNPTRTGYDFAGWTGSNGSTPQTAVSVNLGSTGDKAYTANWTPRNDTHYTVKHYKQNVDNDNYTLFETEDKTGTTAANVTPAVKSYTGFTAPPTQTEAIAADGSMVIEYQYTRNSYELTWDANGGAIAGTSHTSGQVLYEAPITAPENANVTRSGYSFDGWDPAVAATMPAEATTYTAQWTLNDEIEIQNAESVTVSSTETIDKVIVHVGGNLEVESGKLTTGTFIIEAISEVTDTDEAFAAAQSGSGEATGDIEAGVMYFDLILNNPSNRRWNAFTVPFVVDLRKSGNPIQINGETLTLGRGYDIIYYNGATRAAQGPVAACWEYVEDPAPNGGDSILYPGKAYMIASASRAIQTVRFTKATDPDILSRYDGKVSVAANATVLTTGNNGGWNGIGNPTMYHAVMDAGVTLCQVHDGGLIGADGYRTYDMEDKKLYVGKAVFVQVGGNNNDVSVVQATGQEAIKPQTNAAPRHRTREQIMEDRYDVQIAANGSAPADRLLILAEEDKEDKYVILKDLSKAGVSPVRAQMWVDRYGEKLCMNTTALINNKATYPLTIAAPKAGEYEIFLNGQAKEGTTLYLTYDGKAIWNLTYGGYTATLEKGLDTHYGLRVVISKTPTDIEEATIENGDAVRKVIIEDKVFIIRNGEMYSVTGQKAQ